MTSTASATNPLIGYVLSAANYNMTYAIGLCKDIPEDKTAAQPIPGKTMNHAKWVIGQLAVSNDFLLTLLGQKAILPEGWGKLYGNKTIPSSDPGQPTTQELLEGLQKTHDLIITAVKAADAAFFATPSAERLRSRFPTNGDFIVFLLTSHASIHLGQFSAWRRAMGYPSVFG